MRFIKFILVFVIIFYYTITFAAMDSTNYSIPNDVTNQAGGVSSSANYTLEHNFGESITGELSSTNYKINSGFLQYDTPTIIFVISTDTINLGVLSDSIVSTSNVNLTISTSAMNGYTVQAYDDTPPGIANGLLDGGKKIADATTPNNYIISPSAGTEHYGITVTGTHAASGYAGGTKINSLDDTTWINIGSYDTFIADDVLTVQYRASITSDTVASNNYHATTTYICTATY